MGTAASGVNERPQHVADDSVGQTQQPPARIDGAVDAARLAYRLQAAARPRQVLGHFDRPGLRALLQPGVQRLEVAGGGAHRLERLRPRGEAGGDRRQLQGDVERVDPLRPPRRLQARQRRAPEFGHVVVPLPGHDDGRARTAGRPAPGQGLQDDLLLRRVGALACRPQRGKSAPRQSTPPSAPRTPGRRSSSTADADAASDSAPSSVRVPAWRARSMSAIAPWSCYSTVACRSGSETSSRRAARRSAAA